MSVAANVLSVLLATYLVLSARGKLTRGKRMVASITRVGWSERSLDYLAALLLAGAAGLVVGLFWTPAGIAAATCLALYFLVAVAFHIRAHDVANLWTPLAIALVAAATAILLVSTV